MKGMLKSILPVTLAVFAIMIAMSVSASAQGRRCYPHNINARQENQQDRIAQGIKSGSLTAGEAARLESQETRLNAEEARFRASGGGLSEKERGILERQLNRESGRIYREKHDGERQKP